MRENPNDPASKDLPLPEIPALVHRCLKAEQDRNLSDNSMRGLRRYLSEFSSYCQGKNIYFADELTPAFMKTYADHRCMDDKPTLKKAVVWSLRKFGKYLALLQVVNKDPVRNLRHPKFHPRSELPEYLTKKELRRLLEYSALHLKYRDLAIVSLMASSGLRPNEVAHLKRSDTCLREHWLDVPVKGGWIKKTPLSSSMAVILKNYLTTRNDQCDALFVNGKARPVSVSWLQRLVKTTGEQAGLSYSLTCNHLRHTFATYAADQHGKVITKALMGHQRLATTEVYTHLSPCHFKPLAKLHPYQIDEERSRL